MSAHAPATAPQPPDELRLVADQRTRSRPLLLALVAVMTMSAPTAFYVVRVHELRANAQVVARAVARQLEQEAYRRPTLWRFDAPKLVQDVEPFRQREQIARIRVLGARDAATLVEVVEDPGAARVVWERAAIGHGKLPLGTVWVAASLQGAQRAALALLLPFLLVSGLLAGLLYALPLRTLQGAEQRIGALLAALQAARGRLQEENRDLDAELGRRLTELQAAYAELQRRDARLQALSDRALALQEGERRAIARELHDATGQILTAIRLQLQLLAQQANDPQAVLRRGTDASQLVDAAIDEVRRAVAQLGPSIVDDVGLCEAVRRHCRDVAERAGFELQCYVEADPTVRPSAAVEAAVYRIVQEALHNVVRHAGARHVHVALSLQPTQLTLHIDDDGDGLAARATDTSSEPPRRGDGHGLTNMRERAELLGGSFSLHTQPSGATSVRVTLPLGPSEPAAGDEAAR